MLYNVRLIELSIYVVVVAIVMFPIFIKMLARLHNKILVLRYDYFPLQLSNFNLEYVFSKNVVLVILCDSIHFNKKQSCFKVSIHIRNIRV